MPTKSRRPLDFSSPLQGRRWLKLLEEDPLSGIRIKPKLSLASNVLGFSFSSNEYGLRGPADTRGSSVIFGTSYAMGFAVDIGSNWYDDPHFNAGWLNLGLPVGVVQMEALAQSLYKGSPKRALVLYHPNFWQHSLMYKSWSDSGKPIFDVFNWRTGWLECIILSIHKRRKMKDDLKEGKMIMFEDNGVRYLVDSTYSYFEFDRHTPVALEAINAITRLASRFEQMKIVRIPIKQNFVPDKFVKGTLEKTLKNYEESWVILQRKLANSHNVIFDQPKIFELSDYQPFDTHWNEKGNAKFAHYVRATSWV